MVPFQASDHLAVIGVIDPDAYGANTYTSAWLPATAQFMYAAVISVGTMAANSTVDAKLEQATAVGGAGVKDITGSAITQLTEAGTDSDKQVIIQFKQDDLDIAGGFNHFRLSMTVAVAASDSGAVVLALAPRFGPASDRDATTVDQIVTV
jgi:hypothetical protein